MSEWMKQDKKDQLNELLEKYNVIEDTIFCWERTRIDGGSASMMCQDGNVSIPIIQAFDKIRELIHDTYKG